MIPKWSDKHPNKRAKKIYGDAAWTCAIIGAIVFLPIYIATSVLVERLDFKSDHVLPLVMPLVFFVGLPIAHGRGVGALRRAGLWREEVEAVEKRAATFEGTPLEVRESTVASRLGFVTFFVLMVVGCAWLWRSYPFDPLYRWSGGVGAVICAFWGLQILLNLGRPELRLDERGITICQNWTSAHLVRWEKIARLERRRIWGLPPKFSLEDAPRETISLQDKRGKPLVFLSIDAVMSDAMMAVWGKDSSSFPVQEGKPSDEISPQMQRFIAEIERRLMGADLDD